MMNQLLASILTLMAEAPLESPYGGGEMEVAMNIRKYALIALVVVIIVFLIYWFTKKK
jgi:hypothetical protein